MAKYVLDRFKVSSLASAKQLGFFVDSLIFLYQARKHRPIWLLSKIGGEKGTENFFQPLVMSFFSFFYIYFH